MADSLNSLWFENFITLFTYSALISDSTLLAFFVLDIYDVTSFIGNSRAVSVSFPFNMFCFRDQILTTLLLKFGIFQNMLHCTLIDILTWIDKSLEKPVSLSRAPSAVQ